MSTVPPDGPSYTAYPRAATLDVSKLRALASGYFGLSWVFAANFALALGSGLLRNASGSEEGALFVTLVSIPVLFVAVSLLSYPQNKKIADGKGWSTSGAILASFLMGLNSALCCGIIGYVVMQSIASKEMVQTYGVRRGFFGPRKADVDRRIQELSSAQPVAPPPGFRP